MNNTRPRTSVSSPREHAANTLGDVTRVWSRAIASGCYTSVIPELAALVAARGDVSRVDPSKSSRSKVPAARPDDARSGVRTRVVSLVPPNPSRRAIADLRAGVGRPMGDPPAAPEHPNRTKHPNQNQTGGVS
jgi:hypothetical protein